MSFEIEKYPQHRVVYCISEAKQVVYIGEGGPERLGTTLNKGKLDPKKKKRVRTYQVRTEDILGKFTGSAESCFIRIDSKLAKFLPVPAEMKPGRDRETLFSTNVENILLALFGWQTGALPRDNGIQKGGKNKGGWIADCTMTLEKYFDLYEKMGCPTPRQWPNRPWSKNVQGAEEQDGEKYLAVWWRSDEPRKLQIGHCSVAGKPGKRVPHMSNKMKPIVLDKL
jgi:hypothetical protein